jgi:hypothetical protein
MPPSSSIRDDLMTISSQRFFIPKVFGKRKERTKKKKGRRGRGRGSNQNSGGNLAS